ncbi:MAG TPA: hypothetical protein V6C58_03025 [Allocoleopsis sp.]
MNQKITAVLPTLLGAIALILFPYNLGLILNRRSDRTFCEK